MVKIIFYIITIIFIYINYAYVEENSLQNVIDLIDSKKILEAKRILEEIVNSSQNNSELKKANLILADVYKKLSLFKEASQRFEKSITLYPELSDYARYFLADTLLKLQKDEEALKVYSEFLEKEKESRLLEDVLFNKGELELKLKKFQSAKETFNRFIKEYPNSKKIINAKYNLAVTLENLGNYNEALNIYHNIWLKNPLSSFAEKARKNEKNLVTKKNLKQISVSLEEWLSYGKTLLKGGYLENALEVFERLTSQKLPISLKEKVYLYKGECYYKLKKNKEGINILKKLITITKNKQILSEGYLYLAKFYLREGEIESFEKLEKLSKGLPDHSEIKYLLSNLYMREEEYEKAIQFFKELSEYENENRSDSMWKLALIYYLKDDFKNAKDIFGKIVEKFPNSSFKIPALFWKAKICEKLKDDDPALYYKMIIKESPYDYYGHRSYQILKSKQIEVKEDFSYLFPQIESWQEKVFSSFHGKKAILLNEIGFYFSSEKELSFTIKDNNDPSLIFGLAELRYKAGKFKEAQAILRKHFEKYINRGGERVPEKFWHIVYPKVYWETIEKEANEEGVDPYLVLAIIRQESSFQEDAISPVGALGIMQIMPQTAKIFLGKDNFERHSLLDPIKNIEIGIKLMANWLKEFNNNLPLTIASYNAGKDKARIWWNNRKSNDLDEFIDLIPFLETRIYVKKVLANYYEYKRIYNEGL